jgi:hypothetical protein
MVDNGELDYCFKGDYEQLADSALRCLINQFGAKPHSARPRGMPKILLGECAG